MSKDVDRLVTEAMSGGDKLPVHKISMVCVDYFAAQREWIAMCWCGRYKSDRMDTPQAAAQRARMHMRAKPTAEAIEKFYERTRTTGEMAHDGDAGTDRRV